MDEVQKFLMQYLKDFLNEKEAVGEAAAEEAEAEEAKEAEAEAEKEQEEG